MKSLTWTIGNVTITSIVELEWGSIVQEVIPNATKENKLSSLAMRSTILAK